MPDLDNRLARSRTALLDEIEQPPLADVRRRARRIRRRRSAAAGATVLALLGVIGIAARPWQHDGTTPEVTASNPAAITPVYEAGGIKIVGLLPQPVYVLGGDNPDVEFTDRTHGLAATACAQDCPPLARTDDGGLKWGPAAPSPVGGGSADLIAFPGGRWLLKGGDSYWSSADGTNWKPVTPPAATSRAAIGPGELLRYDPVAAAVTVLSPEEGPLGPLTAQPELTIRSVIPPPAADGAWWIGGVVDGRPAVAVSRDSGRSWSVTPLPATAGDVYTVTTGTLGTEVYAVARGEKGELRAVYHSTDSGRDFTSNDLTGAAAAHKAPATVSGDPVPLLDGRLLVIEQGGAPSSWWVSDDGGASFSPVAGLPAVGFIRQTYAGYVAYQLFDSSWMAFSPDGSTWQKLQVH
ncbi:hypothetical protein DFJ67_2953 [Asanoa ferruginea]|uniref:BNR/Asp-box repeat protein n=1 Tax=Asanoa ferruginea TaxID=53367 RepID=A0A3D9ZHT4_9ACTN|nr:hypothetical protein [Asanoa ferruginea]REF96958.1 hypothetical protein DFJ67_2953 [Asanoa ferruginea]GIF53835.1 hypothetical protein Afe04nite_83740 [Asanoa ferruginea]